ncbi:MAG: Flp pilus assembly protein CpaB [Acidobacteriota bacterium]
MDRRYATLIGLSLLFALVVAGVFYRVMAGSGQAGKPRPAETKDVVVAVRALPVGISIKAADVKLAKVLASQVPPGTFTRPEEVFDRPVVSNILPEEPIREGRVAARGSGHGLAPVIPPGMRALAVRVNDVVGVAGFVLPGMRVDVLVTGRPPGREDTMTTTALQNILVLSAGQQIEPDARGQAVNTAVVTLLVTPQQAETLTLAGNEGRIQLVLRNASDQAIEKTTGRQTGELYGGVRKAEPAKSAAAPRTRPAPPPPAAAAPPPPPPPPDEIVVIRGSQRSVEVVGGKKSESGVRQP